MRRKRIDLVARGIVRAAERASGWGQKISGQHQGRRHILEGGPTYSLANRVFRASWMVRGCLLRPGPSNVVFTRLSKIAKDWMIQIRGPQALVLTLTPGSKSLLTQWQWLGDSVGAGSLHG
jgi:hypothetical protein